MHLTWIKTLHFVGFNIPSLPNLFNEGSYIMSKMLKVVALSVLFSSSASVLAQQAGEGNWMIRARAVHINPANKSDAVPALAVPADAIEVSKKWIPEADFSYFFSKNLAAELVLTYPQKHNVTVTQSAIGSFNAGSFKHLPPTLTLQWHFNPEGDFRPYVGGGLNYTRISSDHLSVPGVTGLHLESNSVGLALQAGFDVKLDKQLYFNVDLKKVQIRSDVSNDAGAKVSRVKVDPFLLGIGLGYRF